MSAPRTARDRVRKEMTAEILEAGRQHIAQEGAASINLRKIARDLEIAPSALYRYVGGRDALLTALILAAFRSLAAEAERAAAAAVRQGAGDAERFLAVPRVIRRWALARPSEWGLVFGTPVPGYEAPEETVEPYTRIALAMFRPVVEAHEAGRLRPGPADAYVPVALRVAVAPVREAVFPDMPVETVMRAVQAWAAVLGTITLEVFGHWRNTILDPEQFFEASVRDAAAAIGLDS
jgi:AcrR family transcriptional regulator